MLANSSEHNGQPMELAAADSVEADLRDEQRDQSQPAGQLVLRRRRRRRRRALCLVGAELACLCVCVTYLRALNTVFSTTLSS